SSGLGEIVGANVGPTVSTLTTRVPVVWLPARSMHGATMRTEPTSDVDVDDVAGHSVGSRPEPEPSDQFQVMVTGPRYPPFALAAGNTVGDAAGAVVSISTVRLAVARLPAASVQVAVISTAGPSSDDVDVAGHSAGSRPDPDPSDQFHLTVTA